MYKKLHSTGHVFGQSMNRNQGIFKKTSKAISNGVNGIVSSIDKHKGDIDSAQRGINSVGGIASLTNPALRPIITPSLLAMNAGVDGIQYLAHLKNKGIVNNSTKNKVKKNNLEKR